MKNSQAGAAFEDCYTNDGSSMLVYGNKPLNVRVKITPLNGKSIILRGNFRVSNTSTIVSGADLPNLKCRLYGKPDGAAYRSIAELPKIADDEWGLNNIKGTTAYEYVILELNSVDCSWTGKGPLLVKFYDNNQGSGKSVFENRFAPVIDENVTVERFVVENPVLQGDKKNVTFTWVVNGNNYEHNIFRSGANRDGEKLAEEKIDISGKQKIGESPDTWSVGYAVKAEGDHYFTLRVNKAGEEHVSVTKSLTVRYLKQATAYTIVKKDAGQICNICNAGDGSVLFACVMGVNETTKCLSEVHYSSDGFSEAWDVIRLSDYDKETLKSFSFSPMVHLKAAGEVWGRLIFIGGSKIDSDLKKNAVAVIELDKDNNGEGALDLVKVYSDLDWPARMGHCCALFPHNGIDKIWLMGGQDKNGASLNDVWVSDDGMRWQNLFADGTVNTDSSKPAKMPWQPRCLFGSAVRLNGVDKGELWIGGGFMEFDGSETADLWRWDKKNWQQVKDTEGRVDFYSKPYLSSALTYTGEEIDYSGMLMFGCTAGDNEAVYAGKVTMQGGSFKNIPLPEFVSNELVTELIPYSDRPLNFTTFFFRGYCWFLCYEDTGDSGVQISNVFYYVPKFKNTPVVIQ